MAGLALTELRTGEQIHPLIHNTVPAEPEEPVCPGCGARRLDLLCRARAKAGAVFTAAMAACRNTNIGLKIPALKRPAKTSLRAKINRIHIALANLQTVKANPALFRMCLNIASGDTKTTAKPQLRPLKLQNLIVQPERPLRTGRQADKGCLEAALALK